MVVVIPPELVHARQFIAGPEPVASTSLSKQERFGSLVVSAHRLLALTHEADKGREILCIGHILNPRAPELRNADVVKRLLTCSAGYGEFEEAIAELSGRWLLFVRIGFSQRLYGDAAGLKSAFYVVNTRGLWIASQPDLFAGALDIRPGDDPLAMLGRSQNADVWPPGYTPYPGVRQLLPNHYLDLVECGVHRFWPVRSIGSANLNDAATSIAELLAGSIRAVAQRGGNMALSLTGGYDSRTLLASSWEFRKEIQFFTIVDITSPWQDVWIPYRIASKLGLNFRLIRATRKSRREMEVVRMNTGRIWRDPHEHRVPAFGKTGSDFLLLGNVSEVIRSGYYADGEYPQSVDAELLAYLAGWFGDESALRACSAWLASVPRHTNVNPLDLFYWESRVGGWSSLACTALDAFTEILPPYNCRRLLEIGLGVDRAHLRLISAAPLESCRLHRRICEIGAPETLNFPFNRTWMTGLQVRARPWLPWAVQTAIRRARKRAAGATDSR